MTRNGNAEGARIEAPRGEDEAPKAPRGVGCGSGVPYPPGEEAGEGVVPPPQKKK